MGSKTSIEWTRAADGSDGATWTPIRARNRATGKVGWHCEHATPGCENCYSESFNKRLGTGLPFKPGHRDDIEIFLDEEMLLAPLRWKRPRRIFVCSMTDAFADFVRDEWLDKMFAVAALTPQHTYQWLTKRSARMRDYIDDEWTVNRVGEQMFDLAPLDRSALNWPLPNCWLGVSAEDQRRADERVPDLLATPAAVRFVSAEPLLSGIKLKPCWLARMTLCGECPSSDSDMPIDCPCADERLDWIIAGGESGPNARPMHPYWARSIRDQCEAAGVAFFMKQWGEWAPKPDWYAHHRTSLPLRIWNGERWSDEGGLEGEWLARVGKHRAGRLLDGRTHDAMPVTP